MNNRAFLAKMMHFPTAQFKWKLEQASAIIVQAMRKIRKPKPYVSFSGGKDSTVLLAIALRLYPNIPVFWFDDELEYPETLHMMDYFRQRCSGQFHILQGGSKHAGWFVPWQHKPFFREPLPGTIFDERCKTPHREAWFKDHKYNIALIGTRGYESKKRMAWYAGMGHTYHARDGHVKCCPLWNWTDADVWAAIGGFDLGYNAAYDIFEKLNLDDGFWRVGPLPLAPRHVLCAGWPDLLARMEKHYNKRWME